MGSGIASLHKVLKDETRRRIILLLQEKGRLSYVELMKTLGITNTGKMNYHLKVLGDLLSKKENGQYALTEKGTLASRLLLEFPEITTRQRELNLERPQVFWGGIIICGFAIIDLVILITYLHVAFTSGYTNQLGDTVPFLFLGAVLLSVGSFMIISDVKKDVKISRKLNRLAKRRAVIFTVFLIIMGIALLGLASAHLQTDPPRTQIGYEENPGPWKNCTVFLEQGQLCRVDMAVDAAEIGKRYNISVIQVEETRLYSGMGGPIEAQAISLMFPAGNTGHYEIDWQGLNVTQITVYRVDELPHDLIPRYPLSAAGVFALIVGIGSLDGIELNELSQNNQKKTGFFWWGLIISGLALSWLFGLLWWAFVLEAGFNGVLLPFLGPSSGIGEIVISIVLVYIAFYMMRKGAKKESQGYGSTSELKISKPKFDLSKRNYRAVVYLLASIIINAWLVAIDGSIYWDLLAYVNILGFLLALFVFGIPRMYGGWFDPVSILPFALFVFTLFVEIFVVCEFVIGITKLGKYIKKSGVKAELNSSYRSA
jgi:hypothetical protein